MTPTEFVLAAQAIASAAMCGLIWFVQVVHYPLFARIEGEASGVFAAENQARTGPVVIPFMLVEGFAAAIIAWSPPQGVPRAAAIAGLAAVIAIWLSTACLQMPLHARLSREGHSVDAVAALVRSNWLRTVLWSARAVLAVWMMFAAARHAA